MINIKNQESMFVSISKKLTKKITVYAIGGTAMIFHGYKDSTVDIDLVFNSESERREFIFALKSIGFELMDSSIVYGMRENQPIMLTRTREERFDLFLDEVISFFFSENMKKRAEKISEFGENLVIKVADPHDVILMKCATDRERDKEDIKNIIENSKVDWSNIIKEAEYQSKAGKRGSIFNCIGTFQSLKNDMKVPVPESFFEKIWNICFAEEHPLKRKLLKFKEKIRRKTSKKR